MPQGIGCKKAIGVDGVTKDDYEENITRNIEDLVKGLKQ
jgi:hypothetical protein